MFPDLRSGFLDSDRKNESLMNHLLRPFSKDDFNVKVGIKCFWETFDSAKRKFVLPVFGLQTLCTRYLLTTNFPFLEETPIGHGAVGEQTASKWLDFHNGQSGRDILWNVLGPV
jgi:hypothetical protein